MLENSKFHSKITLSQRDKMRKLFEDGYSICFIARKFKCWPNTVWHHVYKLSTPRVISKKEEKLFTNNSKLTKKQIIEIRNSGLGSIYISRIYNISPTTALGILSGKTYRWVESKTSKEFLVPLEIPKEIRITDLKRGAKKGQQRSVKSGTLVVLGKKYKVAPCTIRRRILKGKISKKEIESCLK
jgi:hypothetical protein